MKVKIIKFLYLFLVSIFFLIVLLSSTLLIEKNQKFEKIVFFIPLALLILFGSKVMTKLDSKINKMEKSLKSEYLAFIPSNRTIKITVFIVIIIWLVIDFFLFY